MEGLGDGWALEVTTIPEPPALRNHPMSAGACDHDWHETDDAGRLRLMQRYFTYMIHRDGIPEEAARAALSRIDDFRGHLFSSEKPDPSEDGSD